MKTTQNKITALLVVAAILSLGSTAKAQKAEIITDIVCSMNVNKAESYTAKYEGKEYYFDSYECKASFETNPKNFIVKKCTPNNNIIDLVCGVKVNLSESFDLKYSGRVYHFHSYDCKQSFKMNPEKFIKNKCATTAKDSIK